MDLEINKAIEILKIGGTILYPTDTIWGLGCDATNSIAIEKIYAIKQRPALQSFIILIDKEMMLNKYVKEVPEIAWELIEQSDSPLTIIYPEARGLAKNVIHQNGSVAIRIVQDEFCKKLLHQFGKPIVATSANISGHPTPINYTDIAIELINKVDYTVNWKQKEQMNKKPSAIIEVGIKGEIKIIRK